MNATAADPHGGGPVAEAGAPLARARLAMVLLHGRGDSAAGILGLAEHLALPDIAFLAPQAAGNSWWPQSFLAPLAANEPGLTSALAAVDRAVDRLEAAGFGPERLVLLGFSQGACLALEYAARNGRPWHLVAGLSGALVGTAETDLPPEEDLYFQRPKRLDYAGSLDGARILMGCHERDPHIPLARVRDSARVLGALDAEVTLNVHPGAGHAVMRGDIAALRRLLNR
jgi:phospholipase/carboxylesterase